MNVDKTEDDGTYDAKTEDDNDDIDFLLYCIVSEIKRNINHQHTMQTRNRWFYYLKTFSVGIKRSSESLCISSST